MPRRKKRGSSDGIELWVCEIEARLQQEFIKTVKDTVSSASASFGDYIHIHKRNRKLAVVKVQSENEAIKLMIHLRGLQLVNSKSRIRAYWNPNISYELRKRWNRKVYQKLDKSKRHHGSFYDKLIEKKKIRYRNLLKDFTTEHNDFVLKISQIPSTFSLIERFHLLSQVGEVYEITNATEDSMDVEYMSGKDTLVALLCYRFFEILPEQKLKVFLPPGDNSREILNKLKSILREEQDQENTTSRRKSGSSYQETSDDESTIVSGSEECNSDSDHNDTSNSDDDSDQEDKSNNNPLTEELSISPHIQFLMKQTEFGKQLHNNQIQADLQFSQRYGYPFLTVTMKKADRFTVMQQLIAYLGVEISCIGLDSSVVNFLSTYDRIRNEVNSQLQQLTIQAGIYKTVEQSISVIALDHQQFLKAISNINQSILVRDIKISGDDFKLVINDQNLKPDLLRDLPDVDQVLLSTKINHQLCSCTITITGFDHSIQRITTTINKRIRKYKMLPFTMTLDIDSYSSSYIQFLQNQLRKIQEQYDCYIHCKNITEDDDEMKHCQEGEVIVRCPPNDHSLIANRLTQLFHNSQLYEKSGISQFSKLGRYLSSSDGQVKLQNLQMEYNCIIDIHSPTFEPFNQPRENSDITPASTVHENSPATDELPTYVIHQASKSQITIDDVLIKLVKGTMQQHLKQFDAIVNWTDFSNFKVGKSAAELARLGGKNYQDQCIKAFKALNTQSIGITTSNDIGCRIIYHIPFFNSDRSLNWLTDKLNQFLNVVSQNGVNSVFIPVMGSDESGLDCNQLAIEIFRTIINYCNQRVNLPKLKVIQFYTHFKNKECYDALQKALAMVSQRQLSWNKTDEIELITQCPTDQEVRNNQDLKSEIVFIAECDTFLEPCKISVEYGTIQHTQGQVAVDMTKLCKQHSSVQLLSENFQLSSSEHTTETIEFDLSSITNLPLCHVCPYGLMSGFSFLLTGLNMSGKKSIVCPLIQFDMSQEDVYELISKYESFLNQYKSSKSRINCFRFLIGNKKRALEIATWIQQSIEQNKTKLQWTITQSNMSRLDGIKLWIAASNQAIIQKIQSRIQEYVPSWRNQCIQLDDDDLWNLEDDRWHRFALEFWCKYNTLVVRNQNQSSHGNLLLYGHEDDIIQAISEIHQISKSKWQQQAEEQMQEFTANSLSWYVKSDNKSFPFCRELNYKIEKFYKMCQKQASTSFIKDFDSYIKTIDFTKMMITTKENSQYNIDRVITQENISIPEYWVYDTVDDVKNGPTRIVDVTNEVELREIANFARSNGIQFNKLQRVQNWNLYYRYQLRKKEVAAVVERYQPEMDTERRLYHGTEIQKITSICRAGFDRDYSGTAHGSLHGTGSYFTNKPQKALRFGKMLLVVRVLTGIYTQSSGKGKPNLQLIPGSTSERVHSVVDHMQNPSIFVVSNDNAAYPEYILHIQ